MSYSVVFSVVSRSTTLLTATITQTPTRDYESQISLSYVVLITIGLALVLAGLLIEKKRSHHTRKNKAKFL